MFKYRGKIKEQIIILIHQIGECGYTLVWLSLLIFLLSELGNMTRLSNPCG